MMGTRCIELTYQYVSVAVDVLVCVEELAVVRDADEQRPAPRGGVKGGELCNLCCCCNSTVWRESLFDVSEADTPHTHTPTEPFYEPSCARGKGRGQGVAPHRARWRWWFRLYVISSSWKKC